SDARGARGAEVAAGPAIGIVVLGIHAYALARDGALGALELADAVHAALALAADHRAGAAVGRIGHQIDAHGPARGWLRRGADALTLAAQAVYAAGRAAAAAIAVIVVEVQAFAVAEGEAGSARLAHATDAGLVGTGGAAAAAIATVRLEV